MHVNKPTNTRRPSSVAVRSGTYTVRWLLGLMSVKFGLSRYSNVRVALIDKLLVLITSIIDRWRAFVFTGGVVTITVLSFALLNIKWLIIFTAPRYSASAVYAVVGCPSGRPSVSPSVWPKLEFYQKGKT